MMRSLLFSPFALRSVTFRNRIMASPMWQYSGSNFFPTDWHFMHLGRMAAGGVALVMQEGTAVERRGCGSVADLGIWDDRFVAPLRRITDFIRSFGAVPGIQLLHCGRRAKMELPWGGRKALRVAPEGLDDFDQWDVVGPSAIAQSQEYHTPRALTLAEIDTVVEAWGSAAERSLRAGYDVIEIHAAHGYLIHEFLSPAANHRNDRYGGSRENRCRLLIEIVEAVRAQWPADCLCACPSRTRPGGRSTIPLPSFVFCMKSAWTQSTAPPEGSSVRRYSPRTPETMATRLIWPNASARKLTFRRLPSA
jgi:2,4-dienoyl-CoA reductase-like NADH-dependent reductase (Old Yellow Enzyme family)